jgi:hypothetical protein
MGKLSGLAATIAAARDGITTDERLLVLLHGYWPVWRNFAEIVNDIWRHENLATLAAVTDH